MRLHSSGWLGLQSFEAGRYASKLTRVVVGQLHFLAVCVSLHELLWRVFTTRQLATPITNDSREKMPQSFIIESQKCCTITSSVFYWWYKATLIQCGHEYWEKGIPGEYLSIPVATTNTIENGEAWDELVSECPTQVILFILFRILYGSKKANLWVSLQLEGNTLLKTLYVSREKVGNRMFQWKRKWYTVVICVIFKLYQERKEKMSFLCIFDLKW